MADLNSGQAVIELVKAEQVRHIFGIVGSTFLDVLDALYDDPSVEYINVRHEQGAAFMADGLARTTGLPAVCLVTSGPGATNLLTGAAAAYVAHSPVVMIAGGPMLGHYAKDAFQEFDLGVEKTGSNGWVCFRSHYSNINRNHKKHGLDVSNVNLC